VSMYTTAWTPYLGIILLIVAIVVVIQLTRR
jgi:hypothetical protein